MQYIKEDLNALNNHRIELNHARERQSVKSCMLEDDLFSKIPIETHENPVVYNVQDVNDVMSSERYQGIKKIEKKSQWTSHVLPRKEYFDSDTAKYSPIKSELLAARKCRIHQEVGHIIDLITNYFMMEGW